MKKKIFILLVVSLLIGVNVYAAGDLKVGGHMAIGSSSSVLSNIALRIGEEQTINAGIGGAEFLPTHSPTTIGNYQSTAMSGRFGFKTANWGTSSIAGMDFQTLPKGNTVAGSSTLDLYGARVKAVVEWGDTSAVNPGGFAAKNIYGFYIKPYEENDNPNSGGTNLSGNMYGLYISGSENLDTVTNSVGIWVDKMNQINASANYGIVLNGDGAGSDIVFGPTQNTSIYSNTGELYAKDQAGNVTQISPHDPETGEWIFYSKNVKTGRVVRVDMEKLVKAVEKLTGEKFMIETDGK